MTLRWRIALILAAIALGVALLAATTSYLGTASQLRRSIDDTLRSRATAVNDAESAIGGRGGRGEHGPGPDGLGDGDCPAAGSFQPASGAQLVATDGTVVACIEGGPTLPITEAERSLAGGAVAIRTVTVADQPYRLLSTPWVDGGTLQIARSLGESDSLLGRLRLQLAALVAGATVLAAGLGWIVATRIVRPIVHLRDTTHEIASTLDMTTPIEVRGTGEVASLAASFSALVAAVRRSQEQQRRLVSDASHEMRTPLTSLRSNIELMHQIERLPIDERREVVADVLEDVDDLSTLLAELVDLASDLAATEPEEPVDLGELARTVSLRTERRVDRVVTVDESATVEVVGRPRQLERAISNLVDNAVKYSAGSTPIAITIAGSTVTVADRGRGIPDEDLTRIFDRFYRALDTRGETGSGLGLSIVDEVVRGHGGTVFARNRDGGGAEVGFTLPTR